jgi:putative SOS response-associated peptidase YedK
MPVILRKDDYDLWLDPGMQNVAAVSEMLKPYDAKSMRSYACTHEPSMPSSC